MEAASVLNRKGIANHTGPESCVAHREVRDEALTGEPAGQPLRLDEKAEEARRAIERVGKLDAL
jgi:hypothetical protein